MIKGFNVSSKFAICGLPVRVDSYRTCSFGCRYCFSENRKIMEFEKTLETANVPWMRKTMQRVHDRNELRENNFLDLLLSKKITWHHGGMSDPFQPCEAKHNITRDIVELSKDYENTILFSTKSDTYHNCKVTPDLHTFSLSITNSGGAESIEPNVPSYEKRKEFYCRLKDEGFRTGIRVQPFIPGITSLDIVDDFCDADNFSLEGLKLVPQNEENKKFILETLKIPREEFIQMGLLNLRPEIRLEMYQPFIERLEDYGIPYSIADNDLHYMGTNSCCCGDGLVPVQFGIDNTALFHKYGEYTKNDLEIELIRTGCADCVCNSLFTSNRQEGCKTVKEFYDKRFDRKSSPFSPKFQYRTQ